MMKKRILLVSGVVALILTGLVPGGSAAIGQQRQSLFVGIFKAANPDFVKKGPSPEDMAVLEKHVEYLQGLAGRGISIVAGHTFNHDESGFGLAIVRADSKAAAQTIMEDDPLVRGGLVTVTVFEFGGLLAQDLQGVSERSSTVAPQPANQEKEEPMSSDLKALAVAYIDAVGQKQFDRLPGLLAPNVEFTGPGGNTIHGAQDYISALRRLGPILKRNEIKKVFVDGNEVCVIYDFVTDTSVGGVPSVEWLRFEDGRIRSSRLVFHTQPWPEVLKELSARSSQAAGERKQP